MTLMSRSGSIVPSNTSEPWSRRLRWPSSSMSPRSTSIEPSMPMPSPPSDSTN
jgi:hypothetical protein